MGDVHYVQEDVCFANLVKGAFECLDKLCWQLAYETYGIAQKKRNIAYYNLPHRGVQSCKELVLCKDIGLGKQVHQCAFSYVCISHKRQAHHLPAVASLRGHLAIHFL